MKAKMREKDVVKAREADDAGHQLLLQARLPEYEARLSALTSGK